MSYLYQIETSEDFDNSLFNIIYNMQCVFPHSAQKFYTEVIEKIKLIQLFPKMYPLFKINPEIRKSKIKNYILIYEIINNKIYILDIIHYQSNFFNNQD